MSPEKGQIRRVCSFIVVSLLFLQQSFSQHNLADLDDYFQKNQKAIGGKFAAAVYKDGKIIYQKAMGDFTLKTQAPILTAANWLTAALVMTFVEQGKISLDDPVSKYLPEFEKYMKNYVTIRHCLAHTTGMENDIGRVGRLLTKKKFQSLEEEVSALAAKEISKNPGEEFHYGNIGPSIAGRVLEVVSKKSFDRLIQERILRPLKMRATNFVNDEGGAVSPSNGAKSTVNDYINFLSMLLNKGMFEGKQILTEKSIAEMQKPQFVGLPMKFSPKETEGSQYGLGNWLVETDGYTTITSPSYAGTWPILDKCRNYAFIIIVQNPLKDDKKDIVMKAKDIIDDEFPCRQ